MTVISQELRSRHPYWQVTRSEQAQIAKGVAGYSRKDVLAAINALRTESPEGLSEKIIEIMGALDTKAQEKLDEEFRVKYVDPWKDHKHTASDLTTYLHGWEKRFLAGTVIPAGIAFYYSRWHKVADVASLCAALTSSIFYLMCVELREVPLTCEKLIDTLTVKTLKEFEGGVEAMYKRLENTTLLAQRYFNAHKSRLENKTLGVAFLGEQLFAISNLLGLEVPGKDCNYGKVKAFFGKFSSLCQKGFAGTASMGLMAFAWALYAYVQKARLMALASIVYGVGLSLISYELFVLKRGSKAIHAVKSDDDMVLQFQKMAQKSLMMRRQGLQTADAPRIYYAVVIPYDAALKLLPAWKPKLSQLQNSTTTENR